MLEDLRLCLVTHPVHPHTISTYQNFLLKVIEGGITSIQLRIKDKSPSEAYEIAKTLKSTLSPFCIPLIINDHVELAKAIDADGVHLGQTDTPPLEARRLLGPHKIIGLSIESLEELECANTLSCINYIAASAVFPSKTKLNCKTIWGIEGLKKITQQSQHPVIAIGGISINNIGSVIASGAEGAAVVSAIHDAPDPQKAAANLIHVIHHFIEKRKHYV